MSSEYEDVEDPYEIALSIGREDDLVATARGALSAYLETLHCSAGAILERRSDPETGSSYEPVVAIPSDPAGNEPLRRGIERVRAGAFGGAAGSTVTDRVGPDDRRVHSMELPSFGAIVLVKPGPRLSADVFEALERLNGKLAEVCRDERRLRTERTRFETVLQTIPEPAVDVVTDEDGRPVVDAVNAAFEEVFGYDSETATGKRLDDLLDGVDPETPVPPGSWATDESPVKREITRETESQRRTFSLRTAPVPTPGNTTEQLGLYVDVTDRRERERTLEELYRAAEDFLDNSDERAVCTSAVDAASEVLDFYFSGVHLYDRESQALVPVAAAGREEMMDTPSSYTDTGTVVWEAYRSGEPVVIDDTETFDGQLPNEDTQARSAIVLPLGNHGVFITSSDRPSAYDESDRYFGRLLATMLRTALDRVGRERALHEIHRTTSSLVQCDAVEEMGTTLVERASQVLGLPVAAVWEYDAADDVLEPLAWTDGADELFESVPTFEPGDSLAWQVFESGQPRMVDDVWDEPDAYDPDTVIGSEIIVPIGDFGVVTAGSTRAGDFSLADLEMLQTLTVGVESALELVERQEELRILDSILARILRHNVRNALTVIHGRAELIADAGPDRFRSHAEEIVRTSEDLSSTAAYAREIREVIDRRDETAVVDLETTIESIVHSMRERYPAAAIAAETDTDRTLDVHPNFESVLRHAVENGIEHNGDDPAVEVRATDTEKWVMVEVEDDGPGISDSEVEPLRTGQENDLTHGSGVGLWIIDRVVEFSGGAVQFDSDGDGTTVTIRFGPSAIVE